jgi:hypothetical protein
MLEAYVYDLMNSGIAVELLVPSTKDSCTDVGIRLRTFGKQLPSNRMVLASGQTFEEALQKAVEKAEDGRWENLNWAARPWECGKAAGPGRYGL